MAPVQIALWGGLGVVLAISVATDLATRRIPDAVTYPALALALVVRAVAEGPGDLESGFWSGLLGGGSALAGFSLLAWRGRMGWGDAKLMGVVGAALGYPLVLAALVFISLCGALQAVVTLVWQRGASRRYIPYGVAIALGSFWAMWWQHSTMLH